MSPNAERRGANRLGSSYVAPFASYAYAVAAVLSRHHEPTVNADGLAGQTFRTSLSDLSSGDSRANNIWKRTGFIGRVYLYTNRFLINLGETEISLFEKSSRLGWIVRNWAKKKIFRLVFWNWSRHSHENARRRKGYELPDISKKFEILSNSVSKIL